MNRFWKIGAIISGCVVAAFLLADLFSAHRVYSPATVAGKTYKPEQTYTVTSYPDGKTPQISTETYPEEYWLIIDSPDFCGSVHTTAQVWARTKQDESVTLITVTGRVLGFPWFRYVE